MTSAEEKKEPSNIFEYPIGNVVNVRMYPHEGKKVRVEVVYHLTYMKKRSQDLTMEDIYTCGEDPTGTLKIMRRHFQTRYNLKLRDETIEKIGKVLDVGCRHFGKPSRSETQAAA